MSLLCILGIQLLCPLNSMAAPVQSTNKSELEALITTLHASIDLMGMQFNCVKVAFHSWYHDTFLLTVSLEWKE